jgi:hypothetical protein
LRGKRLLPALSVTPSSLAAAASALSLLAAAASALSLLAADRRRERPLGEV